MRWRTWGILLGLMGTALLATACGDDGGAGDGNDAGPIAPAGDAGPGNDGGPLVDQDGGSAPLTARVLPTNGSALALTSDDAYAVAANRQAGTITVLRFTPGPTPQLEVVADFEVGAAEPWSVVIGNDESCEGCLRGSTRSRASRKFTR